MQSPKKYFWENEMLSSFLDFMKKLVFAVGIPISIYTFIVDTKKEREEHEYFVYNSVDERYRQYENFAAQYPLLGLSDVVVGDPVLEELITPDSLLTNEEKIIEAQLLNMFVTLQERAYLLYVDGDTKLKKNQFQGWEEDLENWLKYPKFLKAWEESAGYYDQDFEKHVNTLISKSKIQPE